MFTIEALDNSKAIISVNTYALHKMVINRKNGISLDPIMLVWECVVSSKSFNIGVKYKFELRNTNTCKFEGSLRNALLSFANDLEALVWDRGHSKRIFDT